ncbi:MAG: hypothetical protein KBT34_05645 [Prevotella sp.]|nr:hypothetical protein [Candidatus Prevotella equi]
MTTNIGKKCIIRTNRAGVYFGVLADYSSETRTAEIHNCRNIWYWDGAASLMQLATEGVKRPQHCKFTVTVEQIQVEEVIAIIPCTTEAINSIESVTTWKK